MTKNIAVWFSVKDQERYTSLGINTPLKDKIKSLFYEFCERTEKERLTKGEEDKGKTTS